MAKSGGVQDHFWRSSSSDDGALTRPLVSILERGDSYEPLVDLMGGRVTNVDLDGTRPSNPGILDSETGASNEKTAFLKEPDAAHARRQAITRHVAGWTSVLTDALHVSTSAAQIRYYQSHPDLQRTCARESATWRDAEKMQRTNRDR